MKKHTFLVLALFPVLSMAQTLTSFVFEGVAVPTDWKALNGKLSLSAQQVKEGTQSLCWESVGESVLEVGVKGFATASKAAFMQLRSPEVTNDRLKVDFLDADGRIKRTANVEINFKGWQTFNRAYAQYAKKSDFVLSKVRFTLSPANVAAQRKLYFDEVNFNSAVKEMVLPTMWVQDKEQFTGKKYDNLKHQLFLFANPVDIPIVTPTAQEIAEVDLLRSRLPRTATAGKVSLQTARNEADSYHIKRNADGSVTGKPIDCTALANVKWVSDRLNVLRSLRFSKKATEADETLFFDFLDHLMDQGFSAGLNCHIKTSSYAEARYICKTLLDIAATLSYDRRIEVLKLVRWLGEYGTVYYPEGQYLSKFNSDVIYNYLPHMYGYALYQPDYAVAVRELKALKRYLNRHTEVVPGTRDMVKIDGVGFHHRSHYNNYMYAYKTWIEYLYQLRGTSFNMSAVAYPRLREAVLAVFKMANKKTDSNGKDDHFMTNSLAGRNPYKSGLSVQLTLGDIENLIEVGGTILGAPIDTTLAAAYNYFTQSTKYNVPAVNYNGYYQFNYSPIGVARKDDWVVVMRAPTAYFWGAEIYNKQNRFGRYQSHGSLEVIYTGAHERSGFSPLAGSGGWDWNVVPGTTTVHYTSWQEMMPGGNISQRFDQKSTDTNFSGALAQGNCGVFATDFVQGDRWGKECFAPTNLKFKKSVFTFDDLFVALGSDISTSGSYGADMITATNLFQEVKSSYFGDFIVDGSVVGTGTGWQSISGDENHYMVTPLGTGYLLPKGNNDITIEYGDQTSPIQSGADYAAPKSTVTAAKAYIEHGNQPTEASYHFAVVPATTPEKMAKLAKLTAKAGGGVYKVESQTPALHAVTHKRLNVTGYSFFEPVNNIPFGEVIATTAEHLLMVKRDEKKHCLSFAACNPNLRPVEDEEFDMLSTPTTTRLTIKGIWKVLTATAGVGAVTYQAGNTEIALTMKEGLAEYFTLGASKDL